MAGQRPQHLVALSGLSPAFLRELLDRTQALAEEPPPPSYQPLAGRTVANLFYEASTRTRTSFELAARRLGAQVVNIETSASSAAKGEGLLDTMYTLAAMDVSLFVLRHPDSGAADFLARHVGPGEHVLNAGDGRYEHPTQGLLDVLTIQRHKPNFGGLRVAILGDVLHSRVARSLIHALNALGTGEVRVVAPKTLLPSAVASLGVQVYHDVEAGLSEADVVVVLRLQRERMAGRHLPDGADYIRRYRLDEARLALAKPDCLVMHPGPMNRDVEIASDVADSPQSVIREQVRNGVAVRMAAMAMLVESAGGHDPSSPGGPSQ